MKKTIRTYMNTILLFLIPFTLISLILAILSYFIQMNAFAIQIGIQIISYALLIIAALYLTSQLEKNRMKHCICFGLLYFFMSLLIHLGNIHYIHLFVKPLLFIAIGFYKEIRT